MPHFHWTHKNEKSILLSEFPSEEFQIYSFALKCQGFSVSSSSDKVDTIQKCAENRPDIVIIDYSADQRDAVQIAADLALLLYRPKIILMIPRGTILLEAESLGVEMFLQKPCSIPRLLSAVQAVSSLKPSYRFVNI
jgi:DNA-binding response OmpR family regulator